MCRSKRLFVTLAEQWHRETGGHSSSSVRRTHPAYQTIVMMGETAIPLLLTALRDMPDHWFMMLRDITQENPVQFEDRDDYDKMRDAWLAWGKHHGLVVDETNLC